MASAQTVLSNQDFGVLQFFRVDDFQADDPSPSHYMLYHLTFIIVCLLTLDKMFQNVIVELKFLIKYLLLVANTSVVFLPTSLFVTRSA